MGAIHVYLCKADFPTLAQWNEALKAEGFDLKICPFDPFDDDGYQPAYLNGHETALEWFINNVSNLTEEDDYNFKSHIGDCDIRAELSGTQDCEETAIRIAGAVLTKVTRGVYFDAEGAEGFFDGQQAIQVARKALAKWEVDNT